MKLRKSILGLSILFSVTMIAKAQVKIGFEVSFKEPQAHYVEVEMNVSGLASKGYIDVKMPVWTPGSYLVREFSKSVEGFGASSSNKAVKTEKISKNTWRVHHDKSTSVKINYRVYGFESSVRTPFIDADHAFLSPAAVFMYPKDMLSSPSTIKIVPYSGWNKVSTGLDPIAGQPFTYSAPDFDVLFDSPFEIGNQDVFEFMAAGVRHEVAMYGGGSYDKEKLKIDMAKIIDEATLVYGDNPNKHYTFIVHNGIQWSGGLEHLNSCVLGVTRNTYESPGGYNRFLGLVAHEYNHLWNVKRLRPIALGPFDYENENYTTNLWVAEGFTTYYQQKFMFRTGLIDQASFINSNLGNIGTVMNTPGAKITSVADASFNAWVNPAYRPSENAKNTFISYYTKGAVIGLMMDLEIAQATKGAKSLDDVLKAMYKQCMASGKGYTDAEFKSMVEKISGINFTDFWNKYITGTDDIEFGKYFEYAGIEASSENATPNKPSAGAGLTINDGGLFVATVARGSAAWEDGLNVNDEIISIDGVGLRSAFQEVRLPDPALTLDIVPLVNKKQIGDKVILEIKRSGLPRKITLTLKENSNIRLKTSVKEDASALQLAVRKRWLFGK
ncbi:MAG: M61 family peptidase [Pedobacter sp.]|nr:MAG: M61 family peptidase [Pedobacter sp.]